MTKGYIRRILVLLAAVMTMMAAMAQPKPQFDQQKG